MIVKPLILHGHKGVSNVFRYLNQGDRDSANIPLQFSHLFTVMVIDNRIAFKIWQTYGLADHIKSIYIYTREFQYQHNNKKDKEYFNISKHYTPLPALKNMTGYLKILFIATIQNTSFIPEEYFSLSSDSQATNKRPPRRMKVDILLISIFYS